MAVLTLIVLFSLGCSLSQALSGQATSQPTAVQVSSSTATNSSTLVSTRTLTSSLSPTLSATVSALLCSVDTKNTAAGTVNVRSGPGMSNQVLWYAKSGDQLKLTGKVQDGWYQIDDPRGGWFYYTWCKGFTK